MKKLSFAGLKGRVSWGSVFGGVMTVLAISVLLSILNSSIGLFMFDPLSDHPVAGIGTAVGIGSAIILVAGMAAGGFVAGKLAGMDGMIHGFLVWATTLIVAVVLGIFLAVGAAKMTVNTLGAVSSVTGSVLSGTGAVTPLTHSSFLKNARPAFGFGIGKQLTPIFGLGIQGMGYVNTSASKTAFDASEVSLLGKVNLMNLFGGYMGEPRIFEIETLTGIGWLHYYQNGPGDTNSWSTRLGLNLNFNLGEEKAWTLGIKPAIVYDMQGDFSKTKSRFNANNATFELTAGLTYHFMCSNGSHHFTTVKPYDPVEVGELNNAVNRLRSQLSDKDMQLSNAVQQANNLQKELADCRTQAANIETVVKTNRHIPDRKIFVPCRANCR